MPHDPSFVLELRMNDHSELPLPVQIRKVFKNTERIRRRLERPQSPAQTIKLKALLQRGLDQLDRLEALEISPVSVRIPGNIPVTPELAQYYLTLAKAA